MIQLILAVNLFCSFLLCGLIWTIQLVHYPMFHRLDRNRFSEHIRFHGFRISLLVIPLMILELITSASLVFISEYHTNHHLAGLATVLLIWLSTFFLQVPLHSKLMNGYDSSAVNRLIHTNTIRTILWSLKTALGMVIIFG